MKTAIQNGKIVMGTDTISVLENQSIIIENDIILDLLPTTEAHKKYPEASTIDANNRVIFRVFKLSYPFKFNSCTRSF